MAIGAPFRRPELTMGSLRQDLRSSLRHFRRHRGFAAAALLVLALGIGVLIGALVAVGLTRALSALLFGVGAFDVAT